MEVVKYIFPITPRFNVGHKKGIKLKYVGLHCSTLSQNLISILFRIFRATALKHSHIRRQFFLHLSNQMDWKDICLCLIPGPGPCDERNTSWLKHYFSADPVHI